MSSETPPVVVIGTGLAGYSFARAWRKLDSLTPLIMLSQDSGDFYAKPMLSNALAARKTPEMLVTRTSAQMAQEIGAEILSHVTVEHLDPTTQTLSLDGGRVIKWRDLVLAVGADPIRLEFAGTGAERVLSVNDLNSYRNYYQQLQHAKRVVILGAGLIGCEFANDLILHGMEVHVIDPSPYPLGRLLPPPVGARYLEMLQAEGIHFHMNTTANAVEEGPGGALSVVLSSGETLPADIVLSAVGLRPRVALAKAAGLLTGRGIQANEYLQTQNSHIWVTGDCAEVVGWNLPFVMPIMQQAKALAKSLSGQPTPLHYPAMPVAVKTPAVALIVCPPPPGKTGEWAILESDPQGMTAVFHSEGRPMGHALIGTHTQNRQQRVPPLPDWLTF